MPFHPPMVPEMIAVWNAALGDAFPLDEALFRQNAVENPHFAPAGCHVACRPEDGRVLGFSIAKVAREPIGADGLLPDRGWISMIAVLPSMQRRGLGTALLRRGEEFLRDAGRRRSVLGGDPGHFFPGVPVGSAALAFFGARGYRLRGDAYDLRRSLTGYRTPAGVEPVPAGRSDLEIRPLRREEDRALLAFLDAVFPGRWRYTVERWLEGGGAVEEVMGWCATRRSWGLRIYSTRVLVGSARASRGRAGRGAGPAVWAPWGLRPTCAGGASGWRSWIAR